LFHTPHFLSLGSGTCDQAAGTALLIVGFRFVCLR
jgi:hypothetical protein